MELRQKYIFVYDLIDIVECYTKMIVVYNKNAVNDFVNLVDDSEYHFLVKIFINSNTGNVLKVVAGIDPDTQNVYTPLKIRQIINTTEKIKDSENNGRRLMMTIVSIITSDIDRFKNKNSNTLFAIYNKDSSNQERAEIVSRIIEQAIEKRSKDKKYPKFVFIPFSAKLLYGNHIGVVIADLDIKNQSYYIKYFDSSHEFNLGLKDNGNSVFGCLIDKMDLSQNLIPINDIAYQYSLEDDKTGTNCSYWVESFIRNLQFLEKSYIYDSEFCKIYNKLFLIDNFKGLKHLIDSEIFREALEKCDLPLGIDYRNSVNYNNIGIQIATQIMASDLNISDNVNDYPRANTEKGDSLGISKESIRYKHEELYNKQKENQNNKNNKNSIILQ